MKNKLEEIKQEMTILRARINHWNDAYYNKDVPIVDDKVYDAAYEMLVKLEQDYPELVTSDSPTRRVGGTAQTLFAKVHHQFPMMSLGNAFTASELKRFDEQIRTLVGLPEINYLIEPKIDGVSIAVIYEKGTLVRALTRGNGQVGEDVTQNVWEINDIPKVINYQQPLEVRGEIYIDNANFEALINSGENFANPRNAAAGTLRQLSANVVRSRNLRAFFYSVPNALNHELKSQFILLGFLRDQGFKITSINEARGIDAVINTINELTVHKADFPYQIDGFVIKVNDINLWEEIGFTSKAPKFMIAYKLPEEIAKTELLDIFPTVGRTGRITYNARLLPVKLAGTTVSAATLHNATYIQEIGINVGDIVNVKKAAEIIPKVLGVAEKRNFTPWTPATSCPACACVLVRHPGEVDQYCENEECPQRNIAQFEHFVSRNAMNIDELSTKTIVHLINLGFLRSIPSIYGLHQHRSALIALPGFGERSVDNILEAIEKSKDTDLANFLFALGIRHVGEKNSALLANWFGTINRLMSATTSEVASIRDFGEKVANSVTTFFANANHIKLIEELLANGIRLRAMSEPVSKKLLGLTFVLTGKLLAPRDQYERLIIANGGNVTSAVSRATSFVVAGENAGGKKNRAEALGVRIISENELNALIKADKE